MRWNAAIVEMDRYYKTPVLYRNMGIEMFCNFIEDSVKEATFLELIYGDEAKRIAMTVKNSEEISVLFFLSLFLK
jgi:hypothetical protein